VNCDRNITIFYYKFINLMIGDEFMALYELSKFMDGTKSLAMKLFGQKADTTWEGIKTDDAGALKVSAQLADAKPAVATLQNAATVNGNGTNFDVSGYGHATLHVSGTFSATITFQGSVDGTNFTAIPASARSTGLYATTTTTTGFFDVDCRGLKAIRAVISGYASGSVTVKGTAEPFAGSNPNVQLTGSKMELYGATIGDRPAANMVPIGTTFTIVDDTHDFKTWMSNGVDWGEEI
jgi:cytoskeletal protein CcmA (bactofilin family)